MTSDERVIKVATEKGVSPGNILLSYHVARGSSVLAKSVTPSRIQENIKILELSGTEMKSLDEISKDGLRRFVYLEFGINFGFPDKQ